MGRKDDDDESIWDELMKPASMDYNFDGKIDDLDLYIEMDELDKALGRGKYDPYEDPYYIAQKEAEDAEKEYEFDGNLEGLAEQIRDGNVPDINIDTEEIIEKYKCGEIDDSTFSALVDAGYVSYDDVENADSDECDEDGVYSENYEDGDVEDEYVEDSETYTPRSGNSSEKTITLEFSFHDKSEDERKKFPTTGIWRYYNGYDWKFTQALFTFDKKLKEDCGTMYDNCDDCIVSVLGDIYAFDQNRAIADWDWLLKTFPAEILNSSKGESYGMPFSCRLGVSTLSMLFNREDYKLLAEYVKQDYVFDYLVLRSLWEKHNEYYLSELLCCYIDSEELFKKCYETVLKTQTDCYSKKDLGEVWGYFLHCTEWENVGENLKKYIIGEIEKVGDFGKPVLKQIKEIEEELEERRRWEEEERLEAEREEAEERERQIEEAREAAERAEREQQIKILEEMSAPLSAKILNGEYYDEAYKAVDQQFEYCFGSSRKTYDTVARYILGKNGEIKDINKDLQVGVISSKDIKNIFMLTSMGNDISNHNHVKYGGKMPEFESDRKRLEINKPIVEYICRYCYAAKLMQIEAYCNSKKIRNYESAELKKAYNCFRDCEFKARDEAKAIFGEITNSGEVKISWVDEKRLFTYAQLNYPDAVFKYAPHWSEGLCFDIYIPSLNLIIEYKQESDGNANPAEVERHNGEMEKFNKKRKLCEEHDIKFAEWSSNLTINEANFLQLMEKYK